MTSRTHTQRATTWLCLAVAVLIALMPAAGVMVCLGHDGHVGFGAVTETADCPCDHHSAIDEEDPADSPDNDERHPPCDDIALDPPEVFKDAEFAKKLLTSRDTSPDDDSPAIACWFLGPGETRYRDASPPWIASAAVRPREQLSHKRTVVLLI